MNSYCYVASSVSSSKADNSIIYSSIGLAIPILGVFIRIPGGLSIISTWLLALGINSLVLKKKIGLMWFTFLASISIKLIVSQGKLPFDFLIVTSIIYINYTYYRYILAENTNKYCKKIISVPTIYRLIKLRLKNFLKVTLNAQINYFVAVIILAALATSAYISAKFVGYDWGTRIIMQNHGVITVNTIIDSGIRSAEYLQNVMVDYLTNNISSYDEKSFGTHLISLASGKDSGVTRGGPVVSVYEVIYLICRGQKIYSFLLTVGVLTTFYWFQQYLIRDSRSRLAYILCTFGWLALADYTQFRWYIIFYILFVSYRLVANKSMKSKVN